MKFRSKMHKLSSVFAGIFLMSLSVFSQENCGNAVPVTDLTGVVCATSSPGTVNDLGPGSCEEGTIDTWFSFVAQGGSATVDVSSNISGWRPEFLVIESDNNLCTGNLFEYNCFDINGNYQTLSGNLTGLTIGQTYWIVVSSNGDLTTGTLSVCVDNPAVVSNCVDNDDCVDAALLTLNAPGGAAACITDCNNGANPGIDFVGNGCEDSPNPTVWYEFTTAGNAASIDVVLTSPNLSDPEFTIYVGNTCGPWTVLECIEGTGGSASSLAIPVSANQTYVIAVSDVTGDEGFFDLCITQNQDNSSCNTNDALTVTATSMGSPLAGPYQPGEQVTFCYSVTDFVQFNCNYMGAFVPTFGDCWDPSSFNAQGMPNIINTPLNVNGIIQPCAPGPPCAWAGCAGTPAGSWSWFPAGSVTYNVNGYYPAGTPMPAGWYFLSSYNPATGACTGDPTDPDNTYGDGNFPNCGTNTFDYTVCFTLTAGPLGNCGLGLTDCSVTMKTFGDGEFGAWNNIGCTGDAAANFPAGFACCTAPVITPVADQAFCSGGTASATLTSDQDPTVTYSWTVVAGANISGAVAGSGTTISQVLTNSGITVQTAVYTVTANNGSCSSIETFTVTVNPIPTVNDPADVLVCPGATIDPVNFVSVPAGATFNWTNSNTANGLAVSGSGQITPYTAPANATGSNISGNITVTPVLNGCTGPSQVFTIAISPTPTVNDPADILVCPGATINPDDFVSVPAGATFNWTNSNTANGLAVSGSGQIATYTAPANATGANISGNITVTPVLNGCSGPAQIFAIAISPTPTVNDPADIAVCPGATIDPTDFVSVPAGATFDWTNSNTGNGLAASGSGQITPYTAPVNASGAVISGNVTVTPILNGCSGPSQVFTIAINPTPTVNDPADVLVCPGETIDPADFVSVPAGATFNWTNSNTAIGIVASGSGQITPYTAPANATGAVISGNITVTPVLNGCSGPSQVFTIAINPTPTVNDPADVTVCPGTTIDPTDFVSLPAGATFNWTNSNTANGLAASGSGQITPYAAPANATGSTVSGNITVTPVLNGCSGPSQVFVIAISPTPTVNDPLDQELCANEATNTVIFTGNSGTTTYNWTNDNTSIGLAASGSGNINSFIAINAGASSVTSNITVTPVLNGCSGTPQVFSIVVNPIPVIATLGDDPNLCNDNDGFIDVTIPSNGTVSWTGTSSGSSAAIAPLFTIANLTSGSYSVTFTSGAGCISSVSSVTLNNPGAPIINTIADYTSCAVNYVVPDPSVAITGTNITGNQAYYSAPGGNPANLIPMGTVFSAPTNTIIYAYDNNGSCTAEIQFNVIVNSLPSAAITPDPAIHCEGSSIVLNGNPTGGSGVYSHSWTGNVAILNTTSTVNPSTLTTASFGTYNLTYTVTDDEGCIGSDNISVTINQVPTLTLNDPATVCSPVLADITLASVSSTNVGSLSYYTDVTLTTLVADPTAVGPGTYYVVAENAGCAVNGTVEVTEFALPVISLIGTDPLVCNGANGSIDVVLNSGPSSSGSLSWVGTSSGTDGAANLSSSPNITGLTAGAYDVVFTDANGCISNTASTSLLNPFAPIINPIADFSSCAVNYVVPNPLTAITGTDLTGNQAFYSASGGNPADLIAPGNVFSAPTNMIIYAYDINGSCSAEVSFNVVVNSLPTAVVSPDPAVHCEGSSIALNGNPSGGSGVYSHSWSGDVSILDVTNTVNPNTLTTSTFGTYNLTYTVTDDQGCSGSDAISVTINQAPILTLNNPAAVCSPNTVDITAAAVSSTNVGTLSYYADVALTTLLSDPMAVGSGTYYIVANNAGCTANGSVTVTVTQTPILTVVDPVAVCSPNTVDITLGSTSSTDIGNLSYYSDATLTTLVGDPTAVGAGTYYVLADNLGCSVNGTVTVVVNQTPILTLVDPAAVCSPGTVNIAATSVSSADVGSLSYYSDATFTTVISNPVSVGAGTYYVVADNSGCTADGSVTVTVNALPVIASIGNDPSVCNATDGSISVSLTSGPLTTGALSWSGQATGSNSSADLTVNPDVTGLGSGDYDVQFVDDNGCVSNTTSVTLINPGAPILNNPGAQTVCDSYTLMPITGTGLTGNQSYWTATGGTGTQLSVGASINSTQTVYVYDVNGSCSDEESFVVTVNATPSITNPGSQTACASYVLPTINGTNITGSAAYYNNSQANGGTAITGPLTSTQTVWIYDSNGSCNDETSFNVTINPLPTVTGVSGGSTYCSGDLINGIDVAVTGSPNFTIEYTLNGVAQTVTGSASPISLGNTAGVYVVTGIQDATCSNSASGTQTIVVNSIPLAPAAGNDSTYCSAWTLVPMTVQGAGGGSYTWYNVNGNVLGSGSSYTPSDALGVTEYYVSETISGCEGPTSLVTITINQCDITVPTAFTPDGDGVNETWEIVDLDEVYPDNVVTVFNRWGNIVYQHDSAVDGPYDSNPWDGTFNGESLPVASYYFVIDLNDEEETSKTGTVSILKK
jgi:gliding motility-associated-like protein